MFQLALTSRAAVIAQDLLWYSNRSEKNEPGFFALQISLYFSRQLIFVFTVISLAGCFMGEIERLQRKGERQMFEAASMAVVREKFIGQLSHYISKSQNPSQKYRTAVTNMLYKLAINRRTSKKPSMKFRSSW
jgi:hypothetical protein